MDVKNAWDHRKLINGEHPIWKGEWKIDEKVGGLIFVNEKKIADQKGVLKFILGQISKNILSGKSITNISLPVDIFSTKSILEVLAECLAYAPILFDKLASQENPNSVDLVKAVTAFGITMSVLYLDMEKPFNPVLGETFQCFIQGCPVYAEQIFHHPPISAFMMYGKRYRITAQLESKVDLGMNSGCGSNEGVTRVEFFNSKGKITNTIYFCGPGGEVSGLAYGDRKFNIVGKCIFLLI